MILIECIKMAFTSIRANKLRSFLTMLGIIIGISSVILITTIGSTIKGTMGTLFDAMGINYIYIGVTTNNNPENDYFRPTMTEDDMISDADLEQLCARYPDEYMVLRSDILDTGRVLGRDGEYLDVVVEGITSGYFNMWRTKLKKGRLLNDRDEKEGRYSVVVPDTFAEKYADGGQIIGKPIAVSTSSGEEYTFYVVGVYEMVVDSSEKLDPNAPSQIFIPNSVARAERNIQQKTKDFVALMYNTDTKVKDHKAHARDYFMEKYRNNEHFTVYLEDANEVSSKLGGAMAVLTAAFSAIAAISLLVGGIGVMNIMLVSIVERTKEIGIRKAIGAKKSAILFQFVVEAIIICLIGGIIGILTGLGMSILAGMVAEPMIIGMYPDMSDVLKIVVRPEVKPIVISLLTSTGIGVIFGYYPAKRAAKMDPIEALRFDG